MARTRTASSADQQSKTQAAAPMRSRGRGRGLGRARGRGRGRSQPRAVAPTAEPQVDFDDEFSAQTLPAKLAQAPEGFIATPANVVADALSRKSASIGSFAYIPISERPLALDVQALANQFMRLDISDPSHVIACTATQSSLFERIRGRHDDPHLLVLRDTVRHGGAKRMKKDIVAYVDRCLNCQQVNYEHQRPGGLLQKIEIPKRKWECITMDFVVGHPQTQRKFDAVWVIVDRLTKLVHFTPMVVSYSSERLAEIYIREILRLHGIPMSIISD
ncbi:uncharacterized protein [Nicotiana sylvestris]|uniref:uncharacterized protein n=1 Tax=Nicotiana sylvestris TaxID=4096 RepID=UPI00388C6429